MSSIYKKGRDGYYYYQTYVFNKESNKKDKRIFHALRTKDYDSAREMQKKFDQKYEATENSDLHLKNLLVIFTKRNLLSLASCLILIIILKFTLFDSDDAELDNIPSEINISHELKVHGGAYNKFEDSTFTDDESISDKEKKADKDTSRGIDILPSSVIPYYTIERVVELSNAFKQVKVYATIDKNESNASQKLLCKELSKIYNQFSNIVICLYSNNDAGKNLANGVNEAVSIEDQKESWLAMYTYNVVEGEYFDENPTNYLGL